MKTTTDPLRFEEAIAYHAARLKKAGYLPDVEGLVLDLSRQAQAIAATAQLDLATAVYEGIDAAIARGESFADFRARITKVLDAQWGGQGAGPASRLDAIFRTNVQRAYSAGRLRQYLEPDIVALRPVWRFSAIMDVRTSPLCTQCAGVVLPAAHPWWREHQPPLHHRCRSTVIAMSQRSADVVGLTKRPPKAEVGEGFGNVTDGKDFKPDLRKYPRALVKHYKGRPPAPKKAPPPPPPLPAVVGTGALDAHRVAPAVAKAFGAQLRVDVDPKAPAFHIQALQALQKLPPAALERVAKAGGAIHIGPGSVSDLDPVKYPHRAPASAGRTNSQVAGNCNLNLAGRGGGKMLMGSLEPSRAEHLALHEFGHALDWAIRGDPAFPSYYANMASSRKQFDQRWREWKAAKRRDPYFSNSVYGRAETFAEVYFERYAPTNREAGVRGFSTQLHDALTAMLKQEKLE